MAKKNILLVDDDEDLVLALKLVLDSAGYNVITAGSRKEAWQKAQASKPDLAILDVMMEKQSDGFDLARDLRADPKLKDVPIVIATAINQKLPFEFSPDEDSDYVPVNKFMEKPIDPRMLLREVAGLIGGA